MAARDRKRSAGLRVAETLSRLTRWLDEENDRELRRRLPPAPPGRGLPPDWQPVFPTYTPPSMEAPPPPDPAYFAAFRHIGTCMNSESTGIERCRGCAVVHAIYLLRRHHEEHDAWLTVASVVKGIGRVVTELDALEACAQEALRHRLKANENADGTLQPTPVADLVFLHSRLKATERIERLSRFVRDELNAIGNDVTAGFASSEHRVRPKTNPERPLVKELTRLFQKVGFSDEEIVGLIDDGEEQGPGQSAFRAAKDRVRSRRER